MVAITFGIICLSAAVVTHGYVMLQVRKSSNGSTNVDAIIHKSIPSLKFKNVMSKKILDKSQSSNEQVNVEKNAQYGDEKEHPRNPETDGSKKANFENSPTDGVDQKQKFNKMSKDSFETNPSDDGIKHLEDFSKTIHKKNENEYTPRAKKGHKIGEESGDSDDTVASVADSGDKNQHRDKTIDDAIDRIVEFLNNFSHDKSSDLLDNKAESKNFRSGKKPTFVLEINTKSVVMALERFLESNPHLLPGLREFTDKIAEKAAVVYKAMKEEMEKQLQVSENIHRKKENNQRI